LPRWIYGDIVVETDPRHVDGFTDESTSYEK